jgi:hypothetical protein
LSRAAAIGRERRFSAPLIEALRQTCRHLIATVEGERPKFGSRTCYRLQSVTSMLRRFGKKLFPIEQK